MSYQVLARKWRPRNFKEMVGQEHVLRALINALDNDRLHHAFLFTGTRGVGKTTISRILAKSLNCEQGVSASPCGICSSCQEIDEGRFVDLIEVDAASRTKVEDTRELLENVQYAPTRGRYKVYLIDEVHMLSSHSFNALLKTLEEPPPHVKFLLATTDPQKLPVTILSRCLQFSLRRLSSNLITEHITHVLEQEEMPYQIAALHLIAQAADGSMRDALSLLDQAIAYGGSEVKESDVRSMLGTIDRQHVFSLLQGLAMQNGHAIMEEIAQLAAQSPDYLAVCAELISTLQRIAMVQMVPDTLSSDELQQQELTELAQQMSVEEVQLYYQIALHMRRDLPLAPDSRGGLEMGLLRMLAFHPTTEATPQPQAPKAHPPSDAPSLKPNPAAEALANVKKKPVVPAEATPSPHTTAETIKESQAYSSQQTRSNSPASAALAAARDALQNPSQNKEAAPPIPMVAEPAPSTTKEAQSGHPIAQRPPASSQAQAVASSDNWAAIVKQLEIGGMTRQLAMHCTVQSHQDDVLCLCLEPSHEQFINNERKQQLQLALSSYFANNTSLQISVGQSQQENPMQIQQRISAERQTAAETSIRSDTTVLAMLRDFSAEITADSIQPIEK